MAKQTETDQFLTNERSKSSSICCSKWWHQKYHHQHVICQIIESLPFRAIVILLVIIDTALVIGEIMLDSVKIHYECDIEHKNQSMSEKVKDRIELIMEIVHFTSIGILIAFILELFVRIYASGKKFYNIRRRKKEYFDAFIVIISLAIDLYLLQVEKKILREELLFMFSFRLWRFVRIVSSVAEGIRHGERKHKQNLNKQYLNALQRLVELMKFKTNYLNENREDFQTIYEHFQQIDQKCQSSLDELNQNRELTSSLIVVQFIEHLDGIESNSDNSTVAAMLIRPIHI